MLIGIEAERANVPQKTGVEHYAQQLILQFARLSQKGLPFKDQKGNPFEVKFVLYLRSEPEEWIKQLPDNFSYKVMPFPIFWTQLRLSWEMLWHKPDALFIPASAIPLISPKKTVCTIHDSAFLFYPETFTPFMRTFLHYSYKYISWKAWKIVTPSKASKDDLIKYYGTRSDKIQVIHHGYTPQGGKLKNQKSKIKNIGSDLSLGPSPRIGEGKSNHNHDNNYDQNIIPDATSETLNAGNLESSTSVTPGSQITRPLRLEKQTGQEFGMTNDRVFDSTLHATRSTPSIPSRFVLFLSTLQPRKNLEGLIDAIKTFRENHPADDIKLVVAGRVGWKVENILEKIEKNKGFVLYLNHVTDEERSELYQKAEAFCVPSFYEGFGMWILEAFDVGLPVITSNISSMPEVAGEAVEYCDPHSVESIAKALENVLLSPERKTQLRELGLERLKQFSWEKCAQETLTQILS